MIELKNITKDYNNNLILKNINISFRDNEFVAILGPSGSGKTTILNIIGGLLTKTKGSLIIDGIDTDQFKDENWDYYRNSEIGYIFQNYNLINHLSIHNNIIMPNVIKGKINRNREKNLYEKFNVKTNAKLVKDLSGGEQQRVAIARSLINDPKIIICDEPTGALDTKNSVIIMEYMREISKEKLVIMATHNEELAKKYATRIIRIEDGLIINDNKPYLETKDKKLNKIKKTKTKRYASFSLALSNILSKKGRIIITSIAIAISIIGISMVLALSTGFKKHIEKFQKNTLVALPIVIGNENYTEEEKEYNYPNKNTINIEKEINKSKNIITNDYIDFLEKNKDILGISYKYDFLINIVADKNGYKYLNNNDISMGVIPNNDVIKMQYDILYGRLPSNKNELLLMVDGNNDIEKSFNNVLYNNISFKDIEKIKLKIIYNNDLYKKEGNFYVINKDLELLYKTKGEELKIVGIIRMKKDFPSYMSNSGLLYTKELSMEILKNNDISNIVRDQDKSNINLLTGSKISDEEKNILLESLGKKTVPREINIYSKDFKDKNKIINYLDSYKDKIHYTDQAKLIVNLSGNIIKGVTIVLLIFSIISLVVSTIMIGIVIYISVLERKKEIGILRSMGMSKKGIKKMFNYEAIIIGINSFFMGILASRILIIPLNIILDKITGMKKVAYLSIKDITIIFVISILVSLIGSIIPATMASKKDIVSSIKEE